MRLDYAIGSFGGDMICYHKCHSLTWRHVDLVEVSEGAVQHQALAPLELSHRGLSEGFQGAEAPGLALCTSSRHYIQSLYHSVLWDGQNITCLLSQRAVSQTTN